MGISSRRSTRKTTGGRYISFRKKRFSDIARSATLTKLSKRNTSLIRVRSGKTKKVLVSSDVANIYNPKTKKYQIEKIKTVVENSANRNFVRRNIITKGTIIDTEIGKAKVTSRPGQVATLNAVLI